MTLIKTLIHITDNIKRIYIIYTLLFLILLTLLINTKTYGALLIVLLITLLGSIKSNFQYFKPNIWLKTFFSACILYTIYCQVSQYLIGNNLLTMQNLPKLSSGYSQYFILVPIIYISLISVSKSNLWDKNKLFIIFISTSVFYGIASWVEVIPLESGRVKGGTYAIAYGNLSGIITVLALFLLCTRIKTSGNLTKIQLITIFSLILSLISTTWFSFTKTAMLAILVTGVLITIYLIAKLKKNIWKIALLVTGFIFISFSLVSTQRSLYKDGVRILIGNASAIGKTNKLINNYKDDGKDITFRDDYSSNIRGLLWKEAIKMFKAHPWLGIGSRKYHPYKNQSLVQRGSLNEYEKELLLFNQPHNQYLNALAETGIIGFLLLLAILLTPMLYFINGCIRGLIDNKSVHPGHFSGMLFTLSFVIFGITETLFNRTIFTSFFVMMVPIFWSWSEQKQDS